MRHVGFDEYCGAIPKEKGIGVVKEINFVMLEGLENLLQLDRRRVSRRKSPLHTTMVGNIVIADSIEFPNTGIDGKDFGIERL